MCSCLLPSRFGRGQVPFATTNVFKVDPPPLSPQPSKKKKTKKDRVAAASESILKLVSGSEEEKLETGARPAAIRDAPRGRKKKQNKTFPRVSCLPSERPSEDQWRRPASFWFATGRASSAKPANDSLIRTTGAAIGNLFSYDCVTYEARKSHLFSIELRDSISISTAH